MRIVAGVHRSRVLKSPKDNAIRPTSDKVKGAIFSSLGYKVSSGRFLDCYSGTGNMALEALSRGMDYAVMVDASKDAISLIKENVSALKEEASCQIIHSDIFMAINRLEQGFDIIYIDPPYAKQRNEELIQTLLEHQLINDQAIVIVESLASDTFEDNIGDVHKIKEKKYRDTKITFYQKG